MKKHKFEKCRKPHDYICPNCNVCGFPMSLNIHTQKTPVESNSQADTIKKMSKDFENWNKQFFKQKDERLKKTYPNLVPDEDFLEMEERPIEEKLIIIKQALDQIYEYLNKNEK